MSCTDNVALNIIGTIFQGPPGPSGGISSISITSANGFSGSVSLTSGAAAISLTTTVTGLLYGNPGGTVTEATGTQIVSVIGSTPVVAATKIFNPGVTGWSVTPSGNKIYFQYGGFNIGSLDSSGNFVVAGDVVAFGAP